jgi:glycosyltransferase involved in cell wall biosynthesis
MKVLYHCPEYYCRHGGRVHARGFFNALSEVDAISGKFLYPREDPQDASSVGVSGKVPRGKLWFLPATIRSIVRYFVPRLSLTRALIEEIRSRNCDAVVIRTGVNLPMLGKIKRACPRISICLEINSAYFDESFPNLSFRSTFQKWEVKRFSRADAIVTVSSHLKSYLETFGICPDRIIVNQNGVDTDFINITGIQGIRDEFDIPASAFVIGYIGGMEPFRRLPEVIGFIAELRRNGNADIYFLIVGDGKDMTAVQNAIQTGAFYGLKDCIKLAGWRPHSEIPRFLASFDIAIFPFTNEYCSPLKLFEYLGAGLPTIGPDTHAVREVFQDGVHLKLVKQDGSNFINAVLELMNDAKLRADLGHNGRQLVLNEYTWKKNAERVVNHVQNMLALQKPVLRRCRR